MKKFAWIIFLLILVVFVGWVSVNQLKTQKTEVPAEFSNPAQVQEENKETNVSLPVSENLISEQLKTYLPSIGELAYNGKIFCAHHLYGFDEDKENNRINVYAWAYCEEYYLENNHLKMGFGVSEPVLVTMETRDGNLVATSYREPGNGSLYSPSIKEMFPEKYAQEAINGFSITELKPSPKEQAEAYYAE